jgi:hypothetical protein
LAAHSITHYRAADLTTDHESGSRSGCSAVTRLDTARGAGVGKSEMDNEPRTSRPPAHPHGCGELGALAQPGRGRKHWDVAFPGDVRPKGPDGPSGDGRRGWRARRECACAAESRGSLRVGGCSAGTCAYSLEGSKKRSSTAGDFTSVRAAGQKELLRYGPTADTVKPGSPVQNDTVQNDTVVPRDTGGRSPHSNCGERLEAQGGTLLASDGRTSLLRTDDLQT